MIVFYIYQHKTSNFSFLPCDDAYPRFLKKEKKMIEKNGKNRATR